MSDLSTVVQKVEEGDSWRGTIRVTLDDEEHELTIRQLYDPELREVLSKVDREELQSLRDEIPSDVMEEYQELQTKEDLSEEEEERFAELEERVDEESGNIFEHLSEETFEGIRKCARCAVVPSEEDLREAFMERAPEIESEYGIKVSEPSDVEQALQDDIDYLIDHSTDFTSFTIGIQALVETVGESEGNSET